MNTGPNQPDGQAQGHSGSANPGGGGGRRRRRRRGGPKPGAGNGQPQQHSQGGHPRHQHGGQQGQGGGRNRKRNRKRQRGGKEFVGPMDHNYRPADRDPDIQPPNVNHNQNGSGLKFKPAYQAQPLDELRPLKVREDAPTRIFAFIEDLFFFAKINEISKKMRVKVEFVKTADELLEKAPGENDELRPALIIFDLNNNAIKPLTTIPKLRKEYKKGSGTSIVGFLSHIQGDLKLKAQEAGCDVVMPRSAFSQNLPNLLRRHAEVEEEETIGNR